MTYCNFLTEATKSLFFPSITLARKHFIQIAIEQLAGVGKVIFSVGNRLADVGKGFIENGDNAAIPADLKMTV